MQCQIIGFCLLAQLLLLILGQDSSLEIESEVSDYDLLETPFQYTKKHVSGKMCYSHGDVHCVVLETIPIFYRQQRVNNYSRELRNLTCLYCYSSVTFTKVYDEAQQVEDSVKIFSREADDDGCYVPYKYYLHAGCKMCLKKTCGVKVGACPYKPKRWS